jgi:hypothetical protein
MKTKSLLFILSLSGLLLQGCMVAAIGAGVGAVKWANAKKLEAHTKCLDSYNTYLKVTSKSHQKPVSLSEYCKD